MADPVTAARTTRYQAHNGFKNIYYRCSSRLLRKERNLEPCQGRAISARYLEDLVWADCRQFTLNPGDTLAEAQRQVSERTHDAAQVQKEQHELELMIAAKEVERQRAKTLFLRGRLSIDETEAHLDATAAEIERLRGRIAALDAQQQLATVFQAQVSDAELLLRRFQD